MLRPGLSPGLPELLAPAGSPEKLRTAVLYGADAVYLAGKRYGLRARAGNFDGDELAEASGFAHGHGVKVYVTVNVFAHNRDLDGLAEYLGLVREIGVDGLIVADPGILHIARHTVPDLPIHLSTQANVTNHAAVAFWREQGVRRVNLARELGIEEIRTVREAGDTEIEVFVHGALCISYSGRCMLSNYFAGRDANQGDCAHPCRYSYRLVEEKRPGQYFPVEEDERGTYIFNSRDLCLLNRLPELVAAGVDAVKIEGRMKTVYYVAAVTRVYRAALDWIGKQTAAGADPGALALPPEFARELATVGTRGQSENFFSGQPTALDMLHHAMRAEQPHRPVAIVRQVEPLLVEVRNPIEVGDEIEFMLSGLETDEYTIEGITAENGVARQRANPNEKVSLRLAPVLNNVRIGRIFRQRR